MKLILGLGNPGRTYKNTRHNIGIQVINGLAKEFKIKLKKDKTALYKQGKGKFCGVDFILAYPLVFMNLSGESVYSLYKRYRVQLEDLLVVYDDLDLNLGRIRIKPAGACAGHKGIKSVIEHLKSDSFARLRIGIGRPSWKIGTKDFVLSAFKAQEMDVMRHTLHRAVECSKLWLRRGIKEAMNQFNRKREDTNE